MVGFYLIFYDSERCWIWYDKCASMLRGDLNI